MPYKSSYLIGWAILRSNMLVLTSEVAWFRAQICSRSSLAAIFRSIQDKKRAEYEIKQEVPFNEQLSKRPLKNFKREFCVSNEQFWNHIFAAIVNGNEGDNTSTFVQQHKLFMFSSYFGQIAQSKLSSVRSNNMFRTDG